MATETKRAVTKAARDLLLGNRLKVIEALTDARTALDAALERERKATEDRVNAEADVRAAFAEAGQAGWTSKELRQLGFEAPRKPRAAKKEPATPPANRGGEDARSSDASVQL